MRNWKNWWKIFQKISTKNFDFLFDPIWFISSKKLQCKQYENFQIIIDLGMWWMVWSAKLVDERWRKVKDQQFFCTNKSDNQFLFRWLQEFLPIIIIVVECSRTFKNSTIFSGNVWHTCKMMSDFEALTKLIWDACLAEWTWLLYNWIFLVVFD